MEPQLTKQQEARFDKQFGVSSELHPLTFPLVQSFKTFLAAELQRERLGIPEDNEAEEILRINKLIDNPNG